ncbi:MAG: hypothetical protein Q9M24_02735 [Mariprofundaceae bacterium]|nr:hypothetical protein [Mariprofundaceae bacterium]
MVNVEFFFHMNQKSTGQFFHDDMTSSRWTKEQLKLAFNLYCQLPFGKLHKGNKEIIELAGLIGRTPSALAMKLCNIASIDPAITSSGRKGLGNASALDREVWDEFHADWDQLATECFHIREQLRIEKRLPAETTQVDDELVNIKDFTGETKRVILSRELEQRDESFVRKFFLPLTGQAITLPERFTPNKSFLKRHREEVFLGNE